MNETRKMRAAVRVGQPEEKKRGISGSTLKIIAVITMLIDHIGAALVWRVYLTNYPGLSNEGLRSLYIFYIVLREIGRIAFPIYCYLLVEGFARTRNPWKYALRLGVFAFLSEIPFDMAFSSEVLEFGYQNVFFTLLCGLLAMIASDGISRRLSGKCSEKLRGYVEIAITCLCAALMAAVAGFLRTDYGAKGVACIMILYLTRKKKVMQLTAGALAFCWELTAPLAFIPIAFYNGKRGLRMKYFFYIFYPAHLLILYLICLIMGIAWQPAI